MKVKITLKEPQKECLDKVKSDLSLENHEKTIHKLIHGIFELKQNNHNTLPKSHLRNLPSVSFGKHHHHQKLPMHPNKM